MTRPWLRAFSGLCINISAGWFGAAIITPNFSNIATFSNFLTLTRDVIFGIVFLLITVEVERKLNNE